MATGSSGMVRSLNQLGNLSLVLGNSGWVLVDDCGVSSSGRVAGLLPALNSVNQSGNSLSDSGVEPLDAAAFMVVKSPNQSGRSWFSALAGAAFTLSPAKESNQPDNCVSSSVAAAVAVVSCNQSGKSVNSSAAGDLGACKPSSLFSFASLIQSGKPGGAAI